jgi:signal transduction histidine kinase
LLAYRGRLWAPLITGFAALLALTAAGSLVTLRQSFLIFDQLESAHSRHDRIAEALMRLRSDLYLAGILKRDFLLDRTQDESVSYGEQFSDIQGSVEQNLTIIERAFGNNVPEVRRLRTEVAAYMKPLKEALDWEPVTIVSLRNYLLNLQVKQRTAALRMAEEIEKLNTDALRNQRAQIGTAEQDFRQTLVWISAVGLLLGISVAGFTIVYTRRLERLSEDAQSELRQLSQHVVRVQEHERKSISRELHDEVGQMLTGLRMELANLDGPAMQQSTADYQRLQEAKRLTERTLQCVRNLSMVLRPSMLDDLGLSPAVSWQAKEFSRRSGIPVDVVIDGEVDGVPDELRTCVYRVIQEALTNAARHAHASRIRVSVRRQSDRLTLVIEDDGVGFSVQRGRGRHGLGLVGMKERIQELSGNVRIESSPGKGTRILAIIPVQEEVAC